LIGLKKAEGRRQKKAGGRRQRVKGRCWGEGGRLGIGVLGMDGGLSGAIYLEEGSRVGGEVLQVNAELSPIRSIWVNKSN
jgi:hypothetical protein